MIRSRDETSDGKREPFSCVEEVEIEMIMRMASSLQGFGSESMQLGLAIGPDKITVHQPTPRYHEERLACTYKMRIKGTMHLWTEAGRQKWYGCQKVGTERSRACIYLHTCTPNAVYREVTIKRGVGCNVLSNVENNWALVRTETLIRRQNMTLRVI